MKSIVVSYLSGVVFAVGLVIGGMTQPAKVIGFLDVAGNWDPSLLLVMGGAIAVYSLMYWVVRPRAAFQTTQLVLPSRRDIDFPLVAGASLFGLGWGLGGFCPGPAITSIGTGHSSVLLFLGAMLAGMFLFKLVSDFQGRLATAPIAGWKAAQQADK